MGDDRKDGRGGGLVDEAGARTQETGRETG